MIANDVQYRTVKAWLARFEAAAAPAPRTRLQQARIDAARAQADDLQVQVAVYDALRSADIGPKPADPIDGLRGTYRGRGPDADEAQSLARDEDARDDRDA